MRARPDSSSSSSLQMDTPEKIQIANPLSKFEDSPVFNYINNLSPIKPVKSVHITQTFNSLTFASLPSVFTSPHVISHKESRFFTRHISSDPPKPEFSSQHHTKLGKNEAVEDAGQLYDNSADLPKNFDPGVSIGEASTEAPNEQSKFAIELPRTLKYDCGSPDCDTIPCVLETNNGKPHSNGASVSLVPFVRLDSEKVEATNEATGCDWESLISDAADLLIFSSPNDSEAFKGLIQKPLDPDVKFSSLRSQVPQTMLTSVVVSSSSEPQNEPSRTAEASKLGDKVLENIGNTCMNKCLHSNLTGQVNNELTTSIPFPCETVSNLHRGMRRRCLDFEMLAARRKNFGDGSRSSSSIEKQPMLVKSSVDSSRCILPGIGLHLNAIAINLKDDTNAKTETLPSGREESTIPISAASVQSLTSQEPLHESMTSEPNTGETETPEDESQHAEDTSQALALANEEFNQSSPRRKRRRLEPAGETEACKRCNCKKSKCLKLYCECFAAGVYCIEPCSCLDCFNKPIHEDTVLATRKQIESRNPLAFAPKVIRSSDSLPETGDDSSKTPASARHKRGCNCKKSSCLKKYCECYQGGVGCSINCRCEGCKNAFGRKDGSALTGTEAEAEDDETEACEKSGMDKALQKSEILKNEEQNSSSSIAATPMSLYRSLVELPLSSKSKLPRSLLSAGFSSGFYHDKIYGKPSIIRPQSKFEKNFQPVPEDEMPEILRRSGSPSNSIKAASPNSKRISPPLCDLGSTPVLRSSRKLILQSIPSFPSLTPQH